MTAYHVLLALAALAICGVVVAQDILVHKLQQESISAGLTGPYHWWLDGAFVLLATFLWLAFKNGTPLQHALSAAAAGCLILTGASGTWTTWLDKYTKSNGEKIHTGCTAVTFSLALALQLVSNHDAGMWGMTVWGVAAAGVTHYLVANASVTEKIGVLGLCGWLVAWAL